MKKSRFKSSTHTPGPWALHSTKQGGFCIVGPYDKAEDGHYIVCSSVGANPTDQANGRLIEASPQLLKCLESLVSDLDWRGEIADYDHDYKTGGSYGEHCPLCRAKQIIQKVVGSYSSES